MLNWLYCDCCVFMPADLIYSIVYLDGMYEILVVIVAGDSEMHDHMATASIFEAYFILFGGVYLVVLVWHQFFVSPRYSID